MRLRQNMDCWGRGVCPISELIRLRGGLECVGVLYKTYLFLPCAVVRHTQMCMLHNAGYVVEEKVDLEVRMPRFK